MTARNDLRRKCSIVIPTIGVSTPLAHHEARQSRGFSINEKQKIKKFSHCINVVSSTFSFRSTQLSTLLLFLSPFSAFDKKKTKTNCKLDSSSMADDNNYLRWISALLRSRISGSYSAFTVHS